MIFIHAANGLTSKKIKEQVVRNDMNQVQRQMKWKTSTEGWFLQTKSFTLRPSACLICISNGSSILYRD